MDGENEHQQQSGPEGRDAASSNGSYSRKKITDASFAGCAKPEFESFGGHRAMLELLGAYTITLRMDVRGVRFVE